ncbi:MAG TPA: hypothetical protein VFK31_08480 [Rhodanobacteraceae bacterium]|nr:hypothetical protein [Rhodanobacteraceae bacterium]
MQRLRLVVVIITLVLLAGCAKNIRTESLTGTLNAYHSTLRWGDFQHAADFLDPDWREAHPLTPLQIARYQQVRVVGYDEGQGPVPVSDTEVRQTVKIALINRHTMRERFLIDHQIWKWDDQAKRWWLTTGLPDITRTPAQP